MLALYHGAHRWDGPPRIVPSRKGRVEYGPGLYLTTSLGTARSYAKGGGAVLRFFLTEPLRWLEDTRLPFEVLASMLDRLPIPATKKKRVLVDLEASRARSRTGLLPAATLVNLVLYHQALAGQAGPALAEAYVAHGIDAGVDHKGAEDWVVLFNLDKIAKYERVSPKELEDAPRIVRGP